MALLLVNAKCSDYSVKRSTNNVLAGGESFLEPYVTDDIIAETNREILKLLSIFPLEFIK